jgi:hypothetical protein
MKINKSDMKHIPLKENQLKLREMLKDEKFSSFFLYVTDLEEEVCERLITLFDETKKLEDLMTLLVHAISSNKTDEIVELSNKIKVLKSTIMFLIDEQEIVKKLEEIDKD